MNDPLKDWKYWYEQARCERTQKTRLMHENERLRETLEYVLQETNANNEWPYAIDLIEEIVREALKEIKNAN